MDEALKKRLIGAMVLVSLAVIFIPMLLEESPEEGKGIQHSNIPPWPEKPKAVDLDKGPGKPVMPVPERSPKEDLAQAAKPKPQTTATRLEKSEPQPKPIAEETAAKAVPTGTLVAPAVPSGWVVQVGSFSSKENAEKLVAKITAKGLPAFLEPAEIGSEKVYRVRLGPELDRARTEELVRELAKSLKLSGQVVRYP